MLGNKNLTMVFFVCLGFLFVCVCVVFFFKKVVHNHLQSTGPNRAVFASLH